MKMILKLLENHIFYYPTYHFVKYNNLEDLENRKNPICFKSTQNISLLFLFLISRKILMDDTFRFYVSLKI